MPFESGTIVGLESRKSNVGKFGPQQRDEVESRHAPASSEELTHQALCPVSPNRPPDATRCDNSEPAAAETVWKREQRQVAAADSRTLTLNAEELAAPPNPIVPGQ